MGAFEFITSETIQRKTKWFIQIHDIIKQQHWTAIGIKIAN